MKPIATDYERPAGSLISHFSRMAKRGRGINLAQGRPGFPPPDELIAILTETIQDRDLHQYAPGNGDFSLLTRISENYQECREVKTEEIVVVNGATEGISLTFHYLVSQMERPFTVLSIDPVYESYPHLAEIYGVPFCPFAIDPETLEVDFTRMEEVISRNQVKIVIIASPGNPLGKVWTEKEVTTLIRLSEKHDFFIIFDAVYESIYFGNNRPFNPLVIECDRLFFISSYSKTLSITGWRIGYVIAEAGHMERIRAIHDYTGLCAPYMLQRAIALFLNNKKALAEFTESIRTKCLHSLDTLRPCLVDCGCTVASIEGGMFFWAQLPERFADGFEFAVDLFKSVQVAVVPGENFTDPPSRCIRMNIAHELTTVEEAASRFKRFLH